MLGICKEINNCSNKNALAKMGPLSLFRLKTYVSWMHIICTSTDIQAYAVKSGTRCHYQIPYKELFEFLNDDVTNISFLFMVTQKS